MLKLAITTGFCLAFPSAVFAQTAPETLAYLLYNITVPPITMSTARIDILETTPKTFHFRWVHTGQNRQMNHENKNIRIEQKAPCVFSVTGKDRDFDSYTTLDTTLDFTNIAPSQASITTKKFEGMNIEHYYIKMVGVKACSLKGSFRNQNVYYKFPLEGTCSNEIFSELNGDRQELQRAAKAYDYFTSTYCKGRAF